ncbi:MAG: DUF5667 domain-containing protein [Marmoricola sp.]
MTPLSPARRAAEEFASAVDGARGDVADRYADLLTCVDVLREQDVPAPRADFVADLRMRLMDAADTLLLPAEDNLAPVIPLHSPAMRRQRRISIAAAAFVVIGGTAGVAAAAESALPGDALYPIKRGIESAQVSLNSSDAGKGQDLLRQASTRLDEVDGLLAGHESATKVTKTLASFKSSASDGADLLFVAYQRDGRSQDITDMRAMLGSQLAKLDALSANAPSGAQSAFTAARELLTQLDQQASVLCGDCGSGISDRFQSMSSAPTLASLLNGPADRAEQAADEATKNSLLANRADHVAKGTPQAGTKTGDTPPAVDPADPTGPTLPIPTSGTDALSGAVGGLTSGVSTLLKGVGAAGGGALAPLTDTVNSTLETLTKGLLK